MKIKLFRNIDYPTWHSSVALPKAEEMKSAIAQSILLACGERFSDLSFGVTCAFMDSEKIAKYNAEYRGKEGSTDVLSFPEYDFSVSKWEEEFLNAGDSKSFYLGDILISYQNVTEDAKLMGWTPANRVVHLVVHSTLHLLGFDHIEEEDRAVMEGLEIKILSALNLGNPFV